MTPVPHSVLVKVDESDRRPSNRTPGSSTPPTSDRLGWLGLDFTAAEIDWAEVAELVDASYRIVAPTKLIRQLDERRLSADAAWFDRRHHEFREPYPQVQIPTTSVYDYLFGDLADADADRVALVDAKSGAETTYRDMLARIDAFAGALAPAASASATSSACSPRTVRRSRSRSTASCARTRPRPPSTRCSPPRTSPNS